MRVSPLEYPLNNIAKLYSIVNSFIYAAISPADINYDETLSTLRFADRCCAREFATLPLVSSSLWCAVWSSNTEAQAARWKPTNSASNSCFPLSQGEAHCQQAGCQQRYHRKACVAAAAGTYAQSCPFCRLIPSPVSHVLPSCR